MTLESGRFLCVFPTVKRHQLGHGQDGLVVILSGPSRIMLTRTFKENGIDVSWQWFSKRQLNDFDALKSSRRMTWAVLAVVTVASSSWLKAFITAPRCSWNIRLYFLPSWVALRSALALQMLSLRRVVFASPHRRDLEVALCTFHTILTYRKQLDCLGFVVRKGRKTEV